MAENLCPAGSHGLHQTNGIRIHTFISIQQSDCNWEKSGDHNQSDLRCHSKSHPKHQNWRNGNGRYGLCNDHDRIKCLIHYTEPIHHSCKHKCQRDSNEKSVKGFQQSEFRMEKYGWQIAKQGCQHCYRRWKHVGGNNSRNAYHFPAKQNHGHGCNWRYLTGDVW